MDGVQGRPGPAGPRGSPGHKVGHTGVSGCQVVGHVDMWTGHVDRTRGQAHTEM